MAQREPGVEELLKQVAELQAQSDLDQQQIVDLQRQHLSDAERIANLTVALETARLIGAAIGVVMANRHVSREQAFDVLRQASNDTGRKLRDIADAVVSTEEVEGGESTPSRTPQPRVSR